jgi:hypothetical protein
MKNGGAMDGAFSHSPQSVRDAAKAAEAARASQEASGEEQKPAAQRSAGLWSGATGPE